MEYCAREPEEESRNYLSVHYQSADSKASRLTVIRKGESIEASPGSARSFKIKLIPIEILEESESEVLSSSS